MTEEWLPVHGYEARYEVSSFGRVRSLMCGRAVRHSPLVLKGGRSKGGYILIWLCDDRGQKRVSLHALVLHAFHGPRPDGTQGAHLNGHRDQNQKDNLAWKTPLQNSSDKYDHGTVLMGEAHQNAKLTEADVLNIRASSETSRALAAKFSVSQSLISQLKLGIGWGHLANGKKS